MGAEVRLEDQIEIKPYRDAAPMAARPEVGPYRCCRSSFGQITVGRGSASAAMAAMMRSLACW